jgi:cytoskeletal protein CcmA (bactofilin family)
MFSKPVSPKSDVPDAILKNPIQRRSVLHDGIVIKGDFLSDGIVEFGGEIIGDITVDVLVLTGAGKIDGNVRARTATLEGRVNGTIAATDVIVSPTAIVMGGIEAETIRIDFGAQVEGLLTIYGKANT